MKEVLGFSIREVGFYSSIPYLLMWIVSILSGFLCDYLISRQFVSVLNARKLFTALCKFSRIIQIQSHFDLIHLCLCTAGIFPAIFVAIASYARCDRFFVVLCFILAYGFNGNYYPGMRVNALDLAPNYAGSVIAVTNGFGALSGVAAPIFVGIMTPDVIQTECFIG